MYDAIIKGYDQMRIPGDAFLTWINADDILTPGSPPLPPPSGASSKWARCRGSGWGASGAGRGLLVAGELRSPDPHRSARAGMCDSLHWQFVQQEGTYYRNGCGMRGPWPQHPHNEGGGRLEPVAADGPSRHAGAGHLSAGCYTVREGQLSRKYRDTYHSENG